MIQVKFLQYQKQHIIETPLQHQAQAAATSITASRASCPSRPSYISLLAFSEEASARGRSGYPVQATSSGTRRRQRA